jgi:hypothetical protein
MPTINNRYVPPWHADAVQAAARKAAEAPEPEPKPRRRKAKVETATKPVAPADAEVADEVKTEKE